MIKNKCYTSHFIQTEIDNIYTDDCITFTSTRVQECDSDFVAVEEIGTLTARGSNVTQNTQQKKNDKKIAANLSVMFE